jgi:hypothetical protein
MPYKNPEDRKKNHHDYYEKNRDNLLKQMKDYYRNTPGVREACAARAKARYDQIKGTAELGWNCLHSKVARNDWELKLTFEEYAMLIVNRACYYCGESIPEAGHGLDRQDHRLGYVIGNVVPCCSNCNWNKGRIEAAGFTYPRTVQLLQELIAKKSCEEYPGQAYFHEHNPNIKRAEENWKGNQ